MSNFSLISNGHIGPWLISAPRIAIALFGVLPGRIVNFVTTSIYFVQETDTTEWLSICVNQFRDILSNLEVKTAQKRSTSFVFCTIALTSIN